MLLLTEAEDMYVLPSLRIRLQFFAIPFETSWGEEKKKKTKNP